MKINKFKKMFNQSVLVQVRMKIGDSHELFFLDLTFCHGYSEVSHEIINYSRSSFKIVLLHAMSNIV